jgi:hypothetical protein
MSTISNSSSHKVTSRWDSFTTYTQPETQVEKLCILSATQKKEVALSRQSWANLERVQLGVHIEPGIAFVA